MISFILISIALPSIIVFINYMLAPKDIYSEKVSAYECGFDPYGSPRGSLFDIHFYLISILFIIFDLEITFLFPWSKYMSELSNDGVLSVLIFIGVLTAGLFYEWNLGLLRWKKYTY